jgi:hypothetical protein
MRSSHPDVKADLHTVKVYDANNLPLRTHNGIIAQANEIETSRMQTAAYDLSIAYGIKGSSIFLYLSSMSFPLSFPFDFMHLIWENVVKNLILLWTGHYKGLDQGTEQYELSKAIWEAIGKATRALVSSIPSAYGCCPPDIVKHSGSVEFIDL